MKKYILSSIIASAVLITSCGGDKTSVQEIAESGDIKAIRAKKKELSTLNHNLLADIEVLDEAIRKISGDRNLPLITTLSASEEQFMHFVELQGDIATKKNVLIYPEMSGVLYRVYVTEGQRVKKGQLLASIDDGGMSSQLIQLKTQLELAKTTFERQKRLWDQNVGTEIQFLQAKSNYESQEKAVEQLTSQLAKFKITAPFAGIIDDVIKDQGTVVAPSGPGSEVFRIINLSNMYVEVAVPENYISSINVGTEVEVYIPVLDKKLKSKVRQTGNFINPQNRSFTVEVPVQNADEQIKPNMTAVVKINDYSNEKSILIPQSIISENAEGKQYVFMAYEVDDKNIGLAKRQIVETGKTQGDIVEVTSGIKVGDQLINEGARNVKQGQKVKIING
ncbi:efflux RND transporter periplasmic adaptor subunit [Reichenbachiella versicolor]|uniref:efflux RND transporter periplasmic adaptor subunit n=1 Tax=Reichenbachiella versicolor TaxID=1821036 RepID=UPI000D6E8444|nr:efflux RND transporter periplasmic adaptor subunit [Reichenbachiella versicolor]